MKMYVQTIISGFIFASCGVSQQNINEDKDTERVVEEADSRYGYLRTDSGLLGVTYIVENGMAVLDDHIRLPLSSISTSLGEDGLGLTSIKGVRYWTGGRIPYVLPAQFDYPNEWKVMVDTWGRAGVRWVPRDASDKNYVKVEMTADSSCGSAERIGMIGGEQILKLRPKSRPGNCDIQRTIIHEAGHIMGFLHEQMRSDRDSFVTFDISRVRFPATMPQSERTALLQRLQAQSQKIDGTVNMGDYDLQSIMHYSTEQTMGAMRAKNGAEIKQAKMPSERDIESARRIYSSLIAQSAAPAPTATRPPNIGMQPPVNQVDAQNSQSPTLIENKCEVFSLRQAVIHTSSTTKAKCESICSEFERVDANRRCAWSSKVFRAHPEKQCLSKNGSQIISDLKLTTLVVCEAIALSHSRRFPKHSTIWGDRTIR